MADQVERIVLEVDDEPALRGSKRANAAIQSIETSAERSSEAATRAAQAQGDRVARVLDRSRQSIDRIVSSAEKKAVAAGLDPLQKILAERDAAINRVAGDTRAVDRVTEAYRRLIAVQKQADQQASLERAIAASRRAAAETQKFESALSGLQQQQRREAESLEKEISLLERRAAVAGRNRVQTLAVEGNRQIADLRALGASQAQIDRATGAYGQLIAAQRQAAAQTDSTGESLLALAGRFGLVIGLVDGARRVFGQVAESTLYAARTEQLGVALGAVARAARLSEGTIGTLEARLQRTGIVTQDARQSLARLIAAQVDYRKAVELARASQDLGRVAGITSSEAFERLTHAIVTQQPELLRMLGLNVNLQQEFQRFAKATRRSAEELTEYEKKQIAVNAVLQAAGAYTGVYERSAETAGGQILSLKRYALEFSNAFGNEFLPVLTDGIKLLNAVGARAAEAGSLLAKTALAIAAPIYTLNRAIREGFDRLQQARRPDSAFTAEAAAIAERTRQQKLAETASRALVEQEQLREKETLARLEAEDKARKKVEEDRERAVQRVKEAELRARRELDHARVAEVTGLGAIIAKHEEYRREIGLSAAANRDLAAAVLIRLRTESEKQQRRGAADTIKQIEHEGEARRRYDSDRLKETIQFQGETDQIALRGLNARLVLESDRIEAAKEADLRSLEASGSRSLAIKLNIEKRRAEIEEKAAVKTFALRAELLDRELQLEIALMEAAARARGISEQAIADRRDQLIQEYSAKAQELEVKTQAAIDRAREEGVNRQTQLVIDSNQRAFESIQRTAENLLTQLFSTSKSFGDKIKAIFEAAILTPLTRAASIGIARIFTPLLGGAGGSQGQGGSGLFGGLFGGLLNPLAIGSPGAPGGTGGFAGPVAAGGRATGFAGIGASLAASKAGLFGSLSALGNIGSASATAIPGLTGVGIGANGQIAVQGAARGVQGAAGGALLAGGGILAFDGLRRGGLLGLAETTAGGALIGAKFGGPIGALIGAGAGAAAGIVRLFITGATDKIVQKVQSAYGIRIDKGFAKDPLLGIIKQQFGGNIDVGIRSQAVRDLIELYAMSTGQGNASFGAGRPRALQFADSGAGVRELPSFYNGSSTFYTPRQAAPAPVVIESVQLVVGGDSAASFLDGRIAPVVASSPEAVAAATSTAQRLSIGRRAAAGSQLGLVTA